MDASAAAVENDGRKSMGRNRKSISHLMANKLSPKEFKEMRKEHRKQQKGSQGEDKGKCNIV
jgi:hypothetical protein